MTIRPVETVYNGYRFRSRIEARWAVFFDAIGCTYEYEPEGFDLGDGYYYLPDFYFPEHDVWVEIKGKQLTDEERQKIERFCQAKCNIEKTGTRFRLLEGQIPDVLQVQDGVFGIPCFNWITLRECAKVPGVNMKVAKDDPRGVLLFAPWKPDCSTQEMLDGLMKARQARFEHGEKPNP